MDEDEGGGGGLLKKKKLGEGEVDFKEKSGTAWSHSFLNQKPWHPLSYPNQRRKWIAEQTNAQRQRRAEEVAREFAQEQEFFRQTALISKKEKEKVEIMKAVSFMYVRPPGYNAESAKAAELEDERRKSEGSCPPEHSTDGTTVPDPVQPEEKKKSRPKDVFGRTLPTEEEFEVLKNAPRLETGVTGRVKPFGIEVRNVKCLRCGNYGHQSGDRECPLRDAIMPNEENRLKRDDPLTSITAHADTSEPLKWELKQKPGLSPPRGGFKPDDPNQQIVAEDIFDEYGGFLNGGSIPDLLTNFSVKKSRKHSKSKSKHKGHTLSTHNDPNIHNCEMIPCSDSDGEKSSKKRTTKEKRKKQRQSDTLGSSDLRRHHERSEQRLSVQSSSDDFEADKHRIRSKRRSSVSPDDYNRRRHHNRNKHQCAISSDTAENERRHKRNKHQHSVSPDDSYYDRHHGRSKHEFSSPDDSDNAWQCKRNKHRHSISADDSYYDRHHERYGHQLSSLDDSDNAQCLKRNKHQHSVSPDESSYGKHHKRNKHLHSSPNDSGNLRHSKGSKHRNSVSPHDSYYKRYNHGRSFSSDDSDNAQHHKRRHRPSATHDESKNDMRQKRSKNHLSGSSDDSEYDRHHKKNNHRRRHHNHLH